MGVVLRSPAGAQPRYDDPFVIVDRQLAVQAVSRQAEVALSVDEPAGVDAPLEEFLICDNGGHDRGELAVLVGLAFAGAEPSNRLELRTVANPEIRLEGRVTSCGPPPGALLILTPLAGPQRRHHADDQPPTGASPVLMPGQRGMSTREVPTIPARQPANGELPRNGTTVTVLAVEPNRPRWVRSAVGSLTC